MDTVKLGIVGLGNIGTSHAKKIIQGKCPHITLAAIADTNSARLEWAKENIPQAALFDSAEKMYASGTCDAVVIAVPHYDHPPLAIKAFEAGLHVMVEKPAGVYTKQVREMNEAAKKSGKVYAMMFNQRTDHVYRKMRELVRGGTLGEIRRTNWIITNWYRSQSYYDAGDWRATWSGEGGGVLLNQCPHNLDLWQWICGMPKKVHAHMHFGKWHDIEVEDDVTAYVEYENGATGVFVTSTADAPGTNRFEITLDKGKLMAEGGKLYLWELEMMESEFTKIKHEKIFDAPKSTFTEVETDGKSEQHAGVLNAFAENILYGTPLIAGGEEGIYGLTISNAMHLSAFLGREITLPLDEDLFYGELMKRVTTSRRKTGVGSCSAAADVSGSFNV